MAKTDDLANAFLEQMNEFHSYNQPYDDALDAWLHQSYATVIKRGKGVDWSKTYFSPSSATACPRALYHKVLRAKKDKKPIKPHQRRWQGIGGHTGDFMQREILLAERHMKKMTGNEPRFVMGLTEDKFPAFEEFIFTQHPVKHNGEEFTLNGTGDGLIVDRETGEVIIYEQKSKSDGAAKTNYRNMQSPQESHVAQVVAYSLMFGTNTAIICYLNVSKQKWFEKDDKLEDNPDLRAFQVNVTPAMQTELLDKFADITKRAREKNPPLPDLTQWRFSDYQEATIKSLTGEEVTQLEDQVRRYKKSSLPTWQKTQVQSALDDIKRRRAELV